MEYVLSYMSCRHSGDTMQLLGQQFPLTHIPLHAFPSAPRPPGVLWELHGALISIENLCVAPASFLKEVLT